jgi:WD40-like Beta Propeller Repeat/Dockerin type I domain
MKLFKCWPLVLTILVPVGNVVADEVPYPLVTEPDVCVVDGRIVYVADRISHFELRVRQSNGIDKQIFRDVASLGHPAWSKDCKTILFWSRKSGNDEIWSMNVASSALTKLTSDPSVDADPIWSTDGTRIAFVSNRLGKNDIWIMNANGSNQTVLTNGLVGQANDPTWSPDDQRIAFSLCGFASADISLCVLANAAVAARDVRIITTSNGTFDFMPHWGVRGIVFSSDRAGGANGIWTIQPDGKLIINIAGRPEYYYSNPKWLPDGTNIVFSSLTGSGQDSTIQVVGAQGGALQTVIQPMIDLIGDLDGDGDVDRDDVNLLIERRNTEAGGPNDPYDLNHDGSIDALDARLVSLRCTRPGCVVK